MASKDQPRHFCITLLSNASQTLYPANTLSSFKTHLARPVNLDSDGIWEVEVCKVTSRPYNVGTFAKIQVSTENALIYCDLISPQFVGSHLVRGLRSFIQPTTYCNHVFDRVY
jgi:hypothetical protein